MSLGIVAVRALSLANGSVPLPGDTDIYSFLSHSSHISDVNRLSIRDRRRGSILTGGSDNATTTGAALQAHFDSFSRYRHSFSTGALPPLLFSLHVSLIIVTTAVIYLLRACIARNLCLGSHSPSSRRAADKVLFSNWRSSWYGLHSNPSGAVSCVQYNEEKGERVGVTPECKYASAAPMSESPLSSSEFRRSIFPFVGLSSES